MQREERDSWQRADALLAELLEIPREQRPAKLARLLAGAPELSTRVTALLAASEREAGPLDTPIDFDALPAVAPADAAPSLAGRRLGAYTLDEEIGRGGMAVVHRGHRVDGVFEQEVAIKVLGTGLLPTSAVARFHREQELLGRLRHPHIATLLDGGVAEDGTPFLVMERIVGLPIDRYCDERKLDSRQRVQLFLQVASAVAWAHRNLVVHRDIKPGNILVTGDGAAKLLDFGIAKLLEPERGLSEPTEARSRMLTPGYAAPEQVEGRPVTTATDVFGLGKVLERLLATTEPDRDLVNIRQRALHPEPERRYPDARALAEDLERWLAGRPVRATPDSLLYRLRKAIARRRAAAAAVLLIAAVGIAGLVATLVQAERARREERTATAVSDFLIGLFEASDPAESRGREPTVRELLDRGVEQTRTIGGEPLLKAQLLEVLGGVYQSLGRHEPAIELWREALALTVTSKASPARDGRIAELRDAIGVALMDLDRLDEAAAELEQALAVRRRVSGDRSAEAGETIYHQGVLAGHRGDFAAAEGFLREAVEIRRSLGAHDPEGAGDVAEALHGLGTALYNLGRYPEAEVVLREALAGHREARGPDHPDVGHDLNSLANVLARLGRLAEAEPLLREALALRRKLYEESHPLVAQTLNDLAVLLEQGGDLDEAAGIYREALASYTALYGEDHQATVIVRTNLGRLLLVTGDFAEAETAFRASLASLDRSAPEGGDRNRAIALTGLGDALRGSGRFLEAGAELRHALALATDTIRDPAFVAMASLELGRLELESGRLAEAERLLAVAEAGYRERYGADHVRSARAAMWLGACRGRAGDRAGAETLLAAALRTQSAQLPASHPHLAATRAELERLGGG